MISAFEAQLEALEQRDHDALWEIADPVARDDLLTLHRDLHQAREHAAELYADVPEPILKQALEALGAELARGIDPDADDAGPRLLARLVDPSALRFDERARDGARYSTVTIDDAGDRPTAIIHTTGGETFQFAEAGGEWRSLMLRELMRADPRLAELRANAGAVAGALADRRERWRAARDPATPQGAYNRLREALAASPVNGAAVYTLLDASARDRLVALLEEARDAQRRIQRRTTLKQRRDAYSARDLTRYVSADSDRALYAAWAGSEDFVPPVDADDPPTGIEGDPAGGRVTVTTEGGSAHLFVREDDGYWHVSGHADAIDEVLGAPVREAVEALGG